MNKTDELLDKYFAGTTSLQEEKELKSYFNGNTVENNHKKYKPLFQTFRNEKLVKADSGAEIPVSRGISFHRRMIIMISGAVAACLILFFALRFQPASDDFMIVRGKRIDNPEEAREFANAKLEKSLGVIKRNLASYEDNEMVKEQLRQIEHKINSKKK